MLAPVYPATNTVFCNKFLLSRNLTILPHESMLCQNPVGRGSSCACYSYLHFNKFIEIEDLLL
jgi:hypothetical protein